MLIAGRNWAQNNELNVQFHAFQDTRGVTVLSPTVDLSKDFTERTSLRVNFGVDAISAASDSCARCHREGVNSQPRRSRGLSVTRKFDALKLTVGGAYSQENFYRATTGLTSVSRELANGNTTVAGGYTFSLNQPTLHPTQQVENQYQNDAFISFTQTLSKTTIAQTRLRAGQDHRLPEQPVPARERERHPDARSDAGRADPADGHRTAAPGAAGGHLPRSRLPPLLRRLASALERAERSACRTISRRRLLGNFSYRRYDQTGAYFYQPQYVGPLPTYFTADFRLEPFVSGLYTGKVILTPKGPFLWLPSASGFTLQYDRYRADNGFRGRDLFGRRPRPSQMTAILR